MFPKTTVNLEKLKLVFFNKDKKSILFLAITASAATLCAIFVLYYTQAPKMEEKTPLLEPAMKKSMAIEKPLVSSLSSTKSKVKSDEPVYVRLDKFKITEEAFSEIQTKVSDIEKTLLKLKELRDKEQKELESWEQELQLLKSRLDSIDSHLFESIN